ncbi:hypothetical protein QE152_g468 [Popillia japonica]|uniref:Uncharacterized protein n=1 Tax=Popillia japonica TaxID=7064 RepID=A0AAW1NJ37_POPJA
MKSTPVSSVIIPPSPMRSVCAQRMGAALMRNTVSGRKFGHDACPASRMPVPPASPKNRNVESGRTIKAGYHLLRAERDIPPFYFYLNEEEQAYLGTAANSGISISCRSALDNRNKVKGKDVSCDVIKGPRGCIRRPGRLEVDVLYNRLSKQEQMQIKQRVFAVVINPATSQNGDGSAVPQSGPPQREETTAFLAASMYATK